MVRMWICVTNVSLKRMNFIKLTDQGLLVEVDGDSSSTKCLEEAIWL